MDIKIGRKAAALAEAAAALEAKKAGPVLIIDESSQWPKVLFKEISATVELRPEEMWPDGKVRPHAVKTPAGERLRLTEAEYERIVLDMRHRSRAGQGPSSLPRPQLKVGDVVAAAGVGWSTEETFPDFRVQHIKGDGRVIIAALNEDMGPFAQGRIVSINAQEYMVLRASGGTATIRLRRPGEEPRPLPAPASSPAIVLTRSCKVSDMTAAFNTMAEKQRAKELRKQRRLAGLAERREQNRQLGETQRLAAEIRRKGYASGSSIRVVAP